MEVLELEEFYMIYDACQVIKDFADKVIATRKVDVITDFKVLKKYYEFRKAVNGIEYVYNHIHSLIMDDDTFPDYLKRDIYHYSKVVFDTAFDEDVLGLDRRLKWLQNYWQVFKEQIQNSYRFQFLNIEVKVTSI